MPKNRGGLVVERFGTGTTGIAGCYALVVVFTEDLVCHKDMRFFLQDQLRKVKKGLYSYSGRRVRQYPTARLGCGLGVIYMSGMLDERCRRLFRWYTKEVRRLVSDSGVDWVEKYNCPSRKHCGPGTVITDDVIFI